jgi:hypothetical protein
LHNLPDSIASFSTLPPGTRNCPVKARKDRLAAAAV